jgi:hypothetical protein
VGGGGGLFAPNGLIADVGTAADFKRTWAILAGIMDAERTVTVGYTPMFKAVLYAC